MFYGECEWRQDELWEVYKTREYSEESGLRPNQEEASFYGFSFLTGSLSASPAFMWVTKGSDRRTACSRSSWSCETLHPWVRTPDGRLSLWLKKDKNEKSCMAQKGWMEKSCHPGLRRESQDAQKIFVTKTTVTILPSQNPLLEAFLLNISTERLIPSSFLARWPWHTLPCTLLGGKAPCCSDG